jgi:hypothetical protein
MSVRNHDGSPMTAQIAEERGRQPGQATAVDVPGWTRLLPLAGVVAAVLWVAGFLVIESVRPEAETPTANEILAYFQDESAVGIGVFVYMLGSVFFLLFVAALWNRLRTAHGEAGGLTAVVLTAGTITALASLFVYGTDLEAHLDADVISALTAEAYYYFGDFFFVGSHLAAALMVGAAGLMVIRGSVLPRWLGWISVAMAIPLLLPPVGWIVMLFVFPLWVVVTALLLVSRTASDNISRPA